MKLFNKKVAGVAALCVASAFASAANAATDLGAVSSWTSFSISPVATDYETTLSGFASAAGTDNVYSFTLDATGSNYYDVALTGNTLSGGAGALSGFLITLHGPNGYSNGASTAGTYGELFSSLPLATGAYTLDVAATSVGGNATFGGTIDITAVPIPAALPLFGSAIAGLGALGLRRRKKTVAA